MFGKVLISIAAIFLFLNFGFAQHGSQVAAEDHSRVSAIGESIPVHLTDAAATEFRKAPYAIYFGTNTEFKIFWQLYTTRVCTLRWGTTTSYSDGEATTTEYGNSHQHAYLITGLTPATKYYYQVTAGTSQFSGSFVTAPPDNADSVKFLAYGDNRSYPDKHDLVAEKIIALIDSSPGYQTIILNVGDLIYDGDSESDWDDEIFNPHYTNIQKVLSTLGYQVARGNHEGEGTLFKKYFPYPHVADFYWSFDYGPAHFAVIDQYSDYSVGSDQYNWLDHDLNATGKKWKFIVLHKPGWSAGGHSNSTDVQEIIQPLCEKYGVQIVFGGHNHYYSRAVVNGVMHITTGGGGAPLYEPDPSYPNIVATSESYHFCKINIQGNHLAFSAVSTGGAEIDSFFITLKPSGIADVSLPDGFALEQNYPNPFNPVTTIRYTIPSNIRHARMTTLTVYDQLGRVVAVPVHEKQKAGQYALRFDASHLASGVYYYVLKSGNFADRKKMLLIR